MSITAFYLYLNWRCTAAFLYLYHKCCKTSQHCQHHHIAQLLQIKSWEQKAAGPDHFLGGVRGVSHAVQPLQFESFDGAAAKVAELIKGVAATVAAHTTVTWGTNQSSKLVIELWPSGRQMASTHQLLQMAEHYPWSEQRSRWPPGLHWTSQLSLFWSTIQKTFL